MKNYSILISILLFLSLNSFIQAQRFEYKIGFSQCVSDDAWRETMEMEMEIELSLYPDFELIKTDAEGNSQQQIKDVMYLISEGIDLLIISPNESDPLTPIVQEVFSSGIPVIVIDRQISSDSWTAYIGADNYEIGLQAGQYAGSILNGNGKIIEITGLEGSSPAIARHDGFHIAISNYPGIEIIAVATGKWRWADGKQVMDSLMGIGLIPDLVFSHNDFMAAGAYEAALEHEEESNFYFIGIDGLPGEEGGIQYVIDGKLNATLLYPTGGDKAIDIARKVLLGLPFDRNNILQTLLIDDKNARSLKLQNEQLALMQDKIQRQRDIAGSYLKQITNLRLGTFLISGFSFLILLLIFFIVRAYREKQRANRELEIQKRRIEKQNKKLKKISMKLEIATQQKLRFFTNISHEFRTPLTLMTGPIESLMLRDDLPEDVHRQFGMMYRNALRLLRLINQILDFRKLENDKMQLNAGKYDIVKFVRSIKETFDTLAEKNDILFEFIPKKFSLYVWFDIDKLDKVMFNLLSNAFKFTNESGKITIRLSECNKGDGAELKPFAEISVSDNGRGMSEQHVKRIFDRFYQIEQQRAENYFPGTGLGLSLSKGFIELHSGRIEVQSKKDTGTTFSVFLPMGEEHLKEKDKILTNEFSNYPDPHSSNLISEELQYFPTISEADTDENGIVLKDGDKEHLVLIVDDNADLLQYMKDSLVNEYDILTAKDGREAWEMVLHDLPDLVISDVMMPLMDGLELTQQIKKDVKTCHIPVILLTAKISLENKLEGLAAGADSYIPKPFNERHLMLRVRKLLEMKMRVNEYYKENLSFEEVESPVTRMNQRFLDRVAKYIEDHIHNNEFGVEELSIEMGMSRVHLYRKIKQITSMSVSEFMGTVKLKHAKLLIRKGEMSISEVAYASGFSNPSYFAKCFRKQFNQSPSDYLAQFSED